MDLILNSSNNRNSDVFHRNTLHGIGKMDTDRSSDHIVIYSCSANNFPTRSNTPEEIVKIFSKTQITCEWVFLNLFQ